MGVRGGVGVGVKWRLGCSVWTAAVWASVWWGAAEGKQDMPCRQLASQEAGEARRQAGRPGVPGQAQARHEDGGVHLGGVGVWGGRGGMAGGQAGR